jgi:hypothetical protein
MYVGQDYDDIEPGETDVFSLDFTSALVSGQTIAESTWTCNVANTSAGAAPDPSPSSRVSGAAAIVQSGTMTSQVITGMFDGNKYILQATVTTSDGRVLQRYSHVMCRAAI